MRRAAPAEGVALTSDQVPIAVFAKAPIEGYAKTRLAPRLTPAQAAGLQASLIGRTIATALAAHVGPVTLWCAPDRGHPLFSTLARQHSLTLFDQCGADLGERMLGAFERLTPQGPVLLIGCDCPMLAASHLVECAERLRAGDDAVFLPCEDGGYALVGLMRPVPGLFAAMPWSTDAVMAETRIRARQLGLKVAEPAIVWDLDRPADYDRALALGLIEDVCGPGPEGI